MPARFTRSIRWRLLVWLAFLLVCILLGFGVTAYQLERVNQLTRIDQALERRVTALQGDLRGGGPPEPRGRPDRRPPPDFEGERRSGGPGPPGRGPGREAPGWRNGAREIRLTEATRALFDETDAAGFYYGIWSREGEALDLSDNAPDGLPRPPSVRGGGQTYARTRGSFREVSYFTELGDCVLAGVSIEGYVEAAHRFAWILVAAGGAVLAVGLGGCWVIASRALRPVAQISAAASRISAGNLSERIDVRDTEGELGRLAGVLNSTFARLEAAFAEQKHFTADASHELRTPLAVIITEAQTALARERDRSEYREALEGCLEAAQQMRRLADSLLELARFDAGQEALRRESSDLAALARRCAERVRPLADGRNVRIHLDLAPAPVQVDPDRVGQVLVNLLDNAIRHSREHGEVRLATGAEGGDATLHVSDGGEGIPPDDLPHVFERFYRADKGRSGTGGRTGLGLAICRAIVDAHGGTITVESQVGVGTTVTVRLPAG